MERLSVPVFLLANPDDHNMGGGYNGGRLTLEVPRKSDALPTFFHELMHAFVGEQRIRRSGNRRRDSGTRFRNAERRYRLRLVPGCAP